MKGKRGRALWRDYKDVIDGANKIEGWAELVD